MVTYAQIVSLASDMAASNPRWRKGQAAFNALQVLMPDCADSLRHSPIDPFYYDDHLQDFWAFVSGWCVAVNEED